MSLGASSTLTDVAFAVCTALARAKFTAVLTGGSAATVYAPNDYDSCVAPPSSLLGFACGALLPLRGHGSAPFPRGLDFVITLTGEQGEAELRALGFSRRGNFYEHPTVVFTLEFPPGPLAVGEERITAWDTLRRGDELLHVLTPEDSCRDRLASWLFWNDLQGVEQALAVHAAQPDRVSLERLRDWAGREGQVKRFELYESRFALLSSS